MMKTENNVSPLTFRRATTADIPLVQRLAEATFPVTYAQILTPQQSDYMMDWMYSTDSLRRQMLEEGHVFFIGQDVRGEAVGYVSVQPESAELCHLQKLYVLPTCQGHGYGRALFEHALDYARSLGAQRVELNVNRHNRAYDFYCRMGMKPLRSGDFEIGQGYYMNDYIMGITL